MDHPIVWIDLETGGLNPALHQVTQIAAVATELENGFKQIGEPFERKIKLVPGKYTEESLKIQHYDPVVWEEEAIPIVDAIGELYIWALEHAHDRISKTGSTYKAADVAGQNVQFDADFLAATAKRCSVWLPLALWTGGMYDTIQLAKWAILMKGLDPPPNFQLETLCKWRGLPQFQAHDALHDVRATISLADSLMVGF